MYPVHFLQRGLPGLEALNSVTEKAKRISFLGGVEDCCVAGRSNLPLHKYLHH